MLFLPSCLVAGYCSANIIIFHLRSVQSTLKKLESLQFNLVDRNPNRTGGAVVGYLPAWWMDSPLETFLVSICLMVHDSRRFFKTLLFAFVVVASIAILVGLVGLTAGFVIIVAVSLLLYKTTAEIVSRDCKSLIMVL